MIYQLPEAKVLNEQPHKLSVEDLSQEHRDVLLRVIRNVLSTSSVEVTYAQIIDGAPLSEVYSDIYGPAFPLKHPVKTEHLQLCPGVLERTRQIRDSFDLKELKFEIKVGDALASVDTYLPEIDRLPSLTKAFPRLPCSLSRLKGLQESLG